MAAPYHRAEMDKYPDRQAPWRTCVQVVSCACMVGGGLWLFLGDTILALFLPGTASATRIACMVAAALATGLGSAAFWGSLRRLRPTPQD